MILTPPQSEEISFAYVVDTNALIWYLTKNPRLGEQAKRIFDAAEHGNTLLVVSTITLAELYFSDKKFKHFDSFEAVYRDLQSRPEFELIPVYPEDVLELERDAAVPEMHDRIIAGLARRLEIPLIASDPEIVNSGIVKTVW